MRLASLFKKTMIENLRDWKVLILTLSFAPFFVVLMYFYFSETATTPHRVVVVNNDEGATLGADSALNAGLGLVAELVNARYAEGGPIFDVRQERDLEVARRLVQDRSADLLVEIPPEFSRALRDHAARGDQTPAFITTYGDPANAKYIMAAVWNDMIAYEYAGSVASITSPLELRAHSVTGVEKLSDFELYVPGLLALALMMLMFTAAASLIKEKDKGTLIRLRISNMTTFEWLTAVSLTQILIGFFAVALTLITAMALGYDLSGRLFPLTVVTLFSCLAIVGIALVVAASLRTIFDLMTIGSFPFFVLMFFSGGMFPLPQLQMFSVGGRVVNVNDVLPTTHSISALNKVLTFGAGLPDVTFELGAIVVLTVALYAGGTWWFTRRHMRTAT
jgi:ABC-2 type transport system permease protein